MPDLRLGTTMPTALKVGTTSGVRAYQGNTLVWPPALRAPAGRLEINRLTYATIDFVPHNGNLIHINGVDYIIPSDGVKLADTGLAASTLFYIYCWNNAGTLTLEASTTGHATDPATGFEIKSGDPTRSLVGMARTLSNSQWEDYQSVRYVISWFNRRTIVLEGVFFALASITSTTPVEASTDPQCYFLTWGDEAVTLDFSGTIRNSAGDYNLVYFGLDGSPMSHPVGTEATQPAKDNTIALSTKVLMSEGRHWVTIMGSSPTGTLGFPTNSILSIRIRG